MTRAEFTEIKRRHNDAVTFERKMGIIRTIEDVRMTDDICALINVIENGVEDEIPDELKHEDCSRFDKCNAFRSLYAESCEYFEKKVKGEIERMMFYPGRSGEPLDNIIQVMNKLNETIDQTNTLANEVERLKGLIEPKGLLRVGKGALKKPEGCDWRIEPNQNRSRLS